MKYTDVSAYDYLSLLSVSITTCPGIEILIVTSRLRLHIRRPSYYTAIHDPIQTCFTVVFGPYAQWHSKASEGPWFNSNLGALPFPPSTSPLPLPFPSSSSAQPLPLLRSSPQIQLGSLGERCKLPSGVWGGAQPKSNLVHFAHIVVCC